MLVKKYREACGSKGKLSFYPRILSIAYVRNFGHVEDLSKTRTMKRFIHKKSYNKSRVAIHSNHLQNNAD